ncbi:MAG: hypothetical protein N2645_19850 [Clostridia bacterium]|nr:hypothetical protein [Clostridia bacterium]
MESIKSEFDRLSDDEKLDFFKMIMPAMCRIFKQNPQKIMEDMMPYCKEVMKDCNLDMSKMIDVMNKMSK